MTKLYFWEWEIRKFKFALYCNTRKLNKNIHNNNICDSSKPLVCCFYSSEILMTTNTSRKSSVRLGITSQKLQDLQILQWGTKDSYRSRAWQWETRWPSTDRLHMNAALEGSAHFTRAQWARGQTLKSHHVWEKGLHMVPMIISDTKVILQNISFS